MTFGTPENELNRSIAWQGIDKVPMSGLQYFERLVRLGAILCFLAVCWLSLAPDPLPVAVAPFISALSHVAMHFVLATLFLVGWPDEAKRVLAGLAGFAVIVEFLQRLVPSRTFDLLDMVGNLLGVAFGFLFFLAMLRFIRNLRA